MRDHGVSTQGEITEIHDAGRDDYVVVRFHDVQSDEVVADVWNYRWDPEPRVGDTPEIVYDPENPLDNVADARMGPDFAAPISLGVGAAISAALVWPTFTRKLDWNKLAT